MPAYQKTLQRVLILVSKKMHNDQQLEELIPGIALTLRRSVRAIRPSICISPIGQVEVIVPQQLSMGRIRRFIHQHTQWLHRRVAYIASVRNDELNKIPPSQIYLKAIKQTWSVRFDNTVSAKKVDYLSDIHTRSLLIRCNQANLSSVHLVDCVKSALNAWLSEMARMYLTPWFNDVSKEIGLPYTKLTIRAQKTRWGSCSRKKNISLNRCILFLPEQVARYLFIHELCHTRYLNHSKLFWSLVRRHEADCRHLDKSLSVAALQLPAWVY